MAERKSFKAIIIGAVVVLLAIGISVSATLYFLSGQQPEGAEAESQETVDAIAPVTYFRFDKPFITSIAQGEQSRYMQVFLAVAVRDPAVEAALETHLPLLRSRLLTQLGSADFLTLQTEEGRQALRADSLQVINEVLATEGAPAAERVLFMNFVLQ